VNIAGLLGSLFAIGVITADDVHRSLDLLVNDAVHFDRLCAMHALVVHANDKLCKAKSARSLVRFREKLSVRSPRTGQFMWGEDGPSCFLITDIVSTLDKWFAT